MRTSLFPDGTATQTSRGDAIKRMRSAQQARFGPTRMVAATRAGAGIEPLWTLTFPLERCVASKTEPTIAATTDAATTARRIRRYADVRAGTGPELMPFIFHCKTGRFHRICWIPGKTLGKLQDE